MTRTTRYIVTRHGSNAANQSMRERMPVAFVEASSAEAAVACAGVRCYHNQHLRAQAVSRAPAALVRELEEALALLDN